MPQLARRITYKDAGVDIDAADEMVDQIGPLLRRTWGPRVVTEHGGFAGAFRLDYGERLFARAYRDPVLVACTDGVGSKLLVAIQAKRYDTVGVDCVAMNVNDMITLGAEPLLFLDYIAVNKLAPNVATEIVRGVVTGCEEAGCALLGGETAELPDLYRRGHFDLAGFAVGVAERGRLLRPRDNVKPGDDIIGLTSSGLHSNGYALARKALLTEAGMDLHQKPRPLNEPLVDVLLRPTRIYVRAIRETLRRYKQRNPIVGMAHITGGGLPGNVPRILPDDCDAVIRRGAWTPPPIFGLLERSGVAEEELFNVFNMGIGYTLITRPRSTAAVIKSLEKAGETAIVIGTIRRGAGKLELR
ncbi:MAG: phosphoribosylformylglycinamidine cyclo-ligase [Phycisphaerales bacterium]|nr:phosphoribosylformylglycinamidine cyclo-ligase [Phycisphaerales bacterium]